MSNKVLYFPYINVPGSAWFTRMLLYWDNVATIVPMDFIYNPENLDEYTSSLSEAGLLEHIFPAQYTFGFPDFSRSFIKTIEGSYDLEDRQKLFKKKSTVKIHAEKLSEIGNSLIELHLAEEKDRYGWYNVEKQTANEFMCYLAVFLGRHPDLNYAPITDQIHSLHTILADNNPVTNPHQKITEFRLQVLEKALPSPRSSLKPHEILKFKEKHGDELKRFRNEIEMELTLLADFKDVFLQQKRLELLKERIEEETKEIVSQMKDNGWSHILLGKWCPLIGEFPIVGIVPKIIGAVHAALNDVKPVNENSPWAYAAFAHNLQEIPETFQPT